MFGLTFDKLLVIGVIAVFLLGPERLPGYAAKLAQLVKGLRAMANNAKDRMKEEMGDDYDETEWQKLDPRRYDPRRIIREALLDEVVGAPSENGSAPETKAPATGARPVRSERSAVTPFDGEAT